MSKGEITDSELIKLLKKEEKIKSLTEIGVILGMTPKYAKTYVSDVSRGKKTLAPNWKLVIAEKFPAFAEKYIFGKYDAEEGITNEMNEPEPPYSNQQKIAMKHMKDEIKYLKEDVYQLKKQVNKLIELQEKLLNSDQSAQAV